MLARTVLTVTCEAELDEWLGQALPGQAVEYHLGFLAIDTDPRLSMLDEPERIACLSLGQRVAWAAGLGLLHPLQRRLGPSRFAYLAIRRSTGWKA